MLKLICREIILSKKKFLSKVDKILKYSMSLLTNVGMIHWYVQVGVSKEVEKMMEIKDLYHVVVKPGIDQAFVVGVIAVLDNIYGESTYC